MRSEQTLDGLLTPVAMLFEVLGEAQPFELELGLAGEALADVAAGDDAPAGADHRHPSRIRPLWRQSFHDTFKAAGQTAHAAGFKSVGHLAALLGPYLRQSASPRDLAEAHSLTAALFSFLAGDLPGHEAHCLLDIVSQWVSPLTPLPEVVKRLVADCLASDGQVLHRAMQTRLESGVPERPPGVAGELSQHFALPAAGDAVQAEAGLSDAARQNLAVTVQDAHVAGTAVTVARDELAMVAGAWLELAQLLEVVSQHGQAGLAFNAGASSGKAPGAARVWSDAAGQVENLANAMAYMGLEATSALLQLHVFLFSNLGQHGESGQGALVKSLRYWVALWTQAFRAQQAADFRKALKLSGQILDGAQRCAPSVVEDSQRELLALRVIESRQVAMRVMPRADELSISLPVGADKQVMAEMLAEMPVLSLSFGDSLRSALEGSDASLEEARRQLHSLKGLALTAGVAGLATYAHSLEDLLLLLDGNVRDCPTGLAALLTDSANLLVVLTDSVVRGEPAPGGLMVVLKRIVDAVNERVQRKLQPAPPPVLQSETDLTPEAPISFEGLPSFGGHASRAEPARVSKTRSTDWTSAMTQDAAQALEFAQLLSQVASLQRFACEATSLPVLQAQMVQGLSRLKEHLLQLQLLRAPETDDVLEVERQALSSLMPRLNQVVLQAGRVAGKSVQLSLDGGQTLLDTVLLQQLIDPLSHLLRNAIDHGIEAAEERIRIGKPATGLLRLTCMALGDEVELVLHDDGQGLDLAKIRDKAVAMGLVSAAEAIDCTDEQISQWIFAAGLSTKTQAGMLSGRGVGMDVVRRMFDRLQGGLMLETEQGFGTAVHMRIPLVPKARFPAPV